MAAFCPALLRRAGVPAWALAAALAGAASNLVDRAVLGAVRDWLIVGPIVINVADVAVIVGLLVVLRHLAASPRRQDAAP
jgi:lipoprotein signal peptidase